MNLVNILCWFFMTCFAFLSKQPERKRVKSDVNMLPRNEGDKSPEDEGDKSPKDEDPLSPKRKVSI